MLSNESNNKYSCAGYTLNSFISSIDLWEDILKYLIESISSPQNSILTPLTFVIAISIISPLTLNWPLPSISSVLS